MDKVFLHQTINRIPSFSYQCLGSFVPVLVPTFPNGIFAIVCKHFSNMQGEKRELTAKFRHRLYIADSLKVKRTFPQAALEVDSRRSTTVPSPSVCVFYTIYATFHLFKFRQEQIIGVHDVTVLSYISNYM